MSVYAYLGCYLQACLLHAAVVCRAAVLFQAKQACKVRMLGSEVKEGQIGTLALVQLGDPPPRQIWRCVHTHVLMLLHNHGVDHETSFQLPLACV